MNVRYDFDDRKMVVEGEAMSPAEALGMVLRAYHREPVVIDRDSARVLAILGGVPFPESVELLGQVIPGFRDLIR